MPNHWHLVLRPKKRSNGEFAAVGHSDAFASLSPVWRSSLDFRMNQQSKKSNKIWIVLGVLGGFCLLTIGVCCGVGLWLTRFPSVSASASQAFDYGTKPTSVVPNQVTSKSFPGIGERTDVVFGNGSGYGKPAGSNSRLWVYMPVAKLHPGSTPCVLICGAGSTMMTGMKLSEGDEAEHLPYLKAGLIVVAYDLDGPSAGDGPEPKSYEAFRDANAGLVNANIAIEYVLYKIPEVNPKQIFSAGHSSAGTTSLLFAEHEPRLAGCIAFAPCTDLKARVPGALVRTLSFTFDGLPEFLVRVLPEHTRCESIVRSCSFMPPMIPTCRSEKAALLCRGSKALERMSPSRKLQQVTTTSR